MPRTCEKCAAELGDGQDWCLQCGAAAPGSLEGGGPSWRSATVVLGVTAALVLGAAAAAYAALTQPGSHTVVPKVITIAQAPVATPTTPSATTTARRGEDTRRAGHPDDDQTASDYAIRARCPDDPAENPADGAHAEIVGHDDRQGRQHDGHGQNEHGLRRIEHGHDQIWHGIRRWHDDRTSPPRSCSTRTPRAHTTRTTSPQPTSAIRASRSTAKRARAGRRRSNRRPPRKWPWGW